MESLISACYEYGTSFPEGAIFILTIITHGLIQNKNNKKQKTKSRNTNFNVKKESNTEEKQDSSSERLKESKTEIFDENQIKVTKELKENDECPISIVSYKFISTPEMKSENCPDPCSSPVSPSNSPTNELQITRIETGNAAQLINLLFDSPNSDMKGLFLWNCFHPFLKEKAKKQKNSEFQEEKMWTPFEFFIKVFVLREFDEELKKTQFFEKLFGRFKNYRKQKVANKIFKFFEEKIKMFEIIKVLK